MSRPPTRRRLHRHQPHFRFDGLDELIKTIEAEGRAYRKEEQDEDRGKKRREWITITLIAMTFFAVCYQVYEMVKVYEPIKEQAEASKMLPMLQRFSQKSRQNSLRILKGH